MENNKIKEVEIEGNKIYLKKDFFGWRTVNPIKNSDGSINWKNLLFGGSWIKAISILFIVAIILLCLYDYSNAIKIGNECLNKSTVINNLLQ